MLVDAQSYSEQMRETLCVISSSTGQPRLPTQHLQQQPMSARFPVASARFRHTTSLPVLWLATESNRQGLLLPSSKPKLPVLSVKSVDMKDTLVMATNITMTRGSSWPSGEAQYNRLIRLAALLTLAYTVPSVYIMEDLC